MDTNPTTPTAPRWTDYQVRYLDGKGVQRAKSFKSCNARATWLDRNLESGKVDEVLAFADPA